MLTNFHTLTVAHTRLARYTKDYGPRAHSHKPTPVICMLHERRVNAFYLPRAHSHKPTPVLCMLH